jgi:hypothetical protein
MGLLAISRSRNTWEALQYSNYSNTNYWGRWFHTWQFKQSCGVPLLQHGVCYGWSPVLLTYISCVGTHSCSYSHVTLWAAYKTVHRKRAATAAASTAGAPPSRCPTQTGPRAEGLAPPLYLFLEGLWRRLYRGMSKWTEQGCYWL